MSSNSDSKLIGLDNIDLYTLIRNEMMVNSKTSNVYINVPAINYILYRSSHIVKRIFDDIAKDKNINVLDNEFDKQLNLILKPNFDKLNEFIDFRIEPYTLDKIASIVHDAYFTFIIKNM